MTPEDYARMIPREAVEAVKSYMKAAFGGRYVLFDNEWDTCARAACAAMLAAWPGMYETPQTYNMKLYDYYDSLILPLPEVNNDKG